MSSLTLSTPFVPPMKTLEPFSGTLTVLKGIHSRESKELRDDLWSDMQVNNAPGSFNDELSLDQVEQKADESAKRLLAALAKNNT